MNKKLTSGLAVLTLVVFIAFFGFKSVYSADKPTVTTVSAQTNEAQGDLKGAIKESGGREISRYGFKWGTSRDLGEIKSFSNRDKKISNFSATINSLKAGNTYYYQAFAVNSKGSAYGEIKSFTIPVKSNDAPDVIISSPTNKLELIRGAIVHIAATATDDQKVEAMSWYINDAAKIKASGSSISYDWDTSQVDPGEYTLMATAWDGSRTGAEKINIIVQAPVSSGPINSAPQVVKPSVNNNTPSRGDSGDKSRYPLLSKMNGTYGQFRYRDTGGGRIEVDPQWVAENIVTITLPGLNRQVQVHKNAADKFILAFTYIKNGTATINGRQVALLSLISTMDGTYVTRHVMWDSSRGLSNHSWGTAIDINADDHLRYVDPGSEPSDPNLILWQKAFQPAGFSWGNSFSDSMHFELK